jgi:hypothetical protein
MPRTARAIVGGYCYHLINRGNNQTRVFHEHSDYAAFLSLVAETQQRLVMPVLAACLAPNHNALRAGLVARAEQWRWGSLSWRTTRGTWQIELTRSAVPLPDNWANYVNEPQTPAEVESIRTCIQRQRPFGAEGWVEHQAADRGLLHSLAPLGRPRRERGIVK